ncbi:DsbA family protein [Streptosporangium sp. NPDC023825]|uniref:DsbA family protein n=1 Tax=Streptosporangium sp. NPDC023825 TaxID=3154909 RepID=UPI003426C18F
MYADVLCPWCYIGKRRLAAASAQHAGRDGLEIVWRGYELAPEAGRTPGPTAAEAMAGWFGEHGVTGIPSLVIDGRPPVSGIQPVADLRRLL